VREKAPSTPAGLAKAGVRFAFFARGLEKPGDMAAAVRKARVAGLSTADALRALTLSPAEIFGLADRMGSIEPGKIANLVVTKGDLFEEKTEIRCVFVDGVRYEPK
jgi:imidazolonepropionase-like amidohydrolase